MRGHKAIVESLSADKPVEVFVLPDHGLLRFGGFHLNLAAGLEDTLAPSGAPLFEVEIQGNRVRMRVHEAYLQESASPATRQANALTLMDMLAAGVELEVVIDEKATAQRMWSEP